MKREEIVRWAKTATMFSIAMGVFFLTTIEDKTNNDIAQPVKSVSRPKNEPMTCRTHDGNMYSIALSEVPHDAFNGPEYRETLCSFMWMMYEVFATKGDMSLEEYQLELEKHGAQLDI